ncbi:MAG: DNA mismatch repair protein MutS [Deltaproteobacteria bacterium]|nr:DNA mismatch repair protein MutS [Deltaproteobacteria bacterium]
MTKSALDTPMMRQYLAIKAKHPEAILFYRMGDFYEMFLRDAEIAAPLLDIQLTTRDKGKQDAVPMCGVPVHAADAHLKRLAELGHRVAICEQVEDPKVAGGRRLVKREVVEVVTPGLVGDPEAVEAKSELVLAAVSPGAEFGLAVLDATTGRFRATEVASDAGSVPVAILEELERVAPREILTTAAGVAALSTHLAHRIENAVWTEVAGESFDPEAAAVIPEGLGELPGAASARAATALFGYLHANQPFALAHTGSVDFYGLGDAMVLDAATCAHLELFRNSEDGTKQRTLLDRIDAAVTPLGSRRLARWMKYPLLDPANVLRRQDAVAFLVDRDRPRARLRDALRHVRDLERLLAKAARPSSAPRDLGALRASLEALPDVRTSLGDADEGRISAGPAGWPNALKLPVLLPDVADLLREALIDDPPVIAKGSRGAGETGYIRDGFRSELDGLREAMVKGREWIAGLESSERKRSGISTLKIRFHPVHGYSIEVTKANLNRVPADYERKQTLANAERYTTPELREVEAKVLGAKDRAATLEREVFEAVRCSVLEHAARIQEAADAVADLDALATLAEVARRDGWSRPVVDSGDGLEIRAGRHPVVEPLLAAQGGGEFVANDAVLSPSETQILILTGPNMSGKSTYLRQVALIVLLAQMGSFVPAESARVGIVDRVFTRVGASDRLARGESTFMVEMRETAEILASATRRSLIILDEIGRGTSTFDGLSIAWAVAEHLHDAPRLGARTLFATHYHELTDLAQTKERVANAHFRAKEWGEDVIFLRQLEPGGANRSYGIQVARLAGLPGDVIVRAREILANLEGGEFDERGRPRLAGESGTQPVAAGQLGLFGGDGVPSPAEKETLDTLRMLDLDRTTPLEALDVLAHLAAKLRDEGRS